MTTPQVDIPAGTVITLSSRDWKYGSGTLRLRVKRIMHELNRYEPGWVWIEGTRLDNERGAHWYQVLARIDALPKPEHHAAG